METSNLVSFEGGVRWVLQCDPCPASRPRVPRYGKPYYVGRYRDFREALADLLAEEAHDLPRPVEYPLSVSVAFVVKRPAKPANPYPIGDIDNYVKAILDSLQGKAFLQDDKQVMHLWAYKRYVNPGEQPHIDIKFTKENPQCVRFLTWDPPGSRSTS